MAAHRAGGGDRVTTTAGPGTAAPEDLDPAALAALAARLVERLGADLPPDGLDLARVPHDGPGLPVPVAGRPRVLRWLAGR